MAEKWVSLAKHLNRETRLKIGREIGTGAFAVVYEGELNGKSVAVKRTHSPSWLDDDAMFHSALLLKQLSHPHIVKFVEFTESKDGDRVLVMEMLDCTLGSYLDRHADKLSRERQIDFCLQIADAVHYLHSQQPPVAYRSLTGRNILLSGDGMLKLCSSLLSARVPSCGYFDVDQPVTIAYMPPEALAFGARHNEKIDIFSLGVVALQIATQQEPSPKRRAVDLSRLPEDHPLKPIILQCLRDDPGERPDSGAVFRMLSEGKTLSGG